MKKGESYLSVEWLEYLGQPGRSDEIRAVIEILSKKLRLGAQKPEGLCVRREVDGRVAGRAKQDRPNFHANLSKHVSMRPLVRNGLQVGSRVYNRPLMPIQP